MYAEKEKQNNHEIAELEQEATRNRPNALHLKP